MKIKPLGNRILVKTIKEVSTTKSGIILSDSSTKQDIFTAKVIEVSDDVTCISKDDTVIFSKFKGENIRINELDYIIIEVKDILAKEQSNE